MNLPDAHLDDAALVARYLEHARFEKRLAGRTLEIYCHHLDNLQNLAQEQGLTLTRVQAHEVRQWIARLHSQGRSASGLALVLSVWRGFYAWLGVQGQVGVNPVQGVRAPKKARKLPQALSVDEAVRLADYAGPSGADADPWLQARDAALVELLYGSGLRVAELVNLDVQASQAARQAGRGWLQLDEFQVQVQGKGGKRRSVPLSGQAVVALRVWLDKRAQLPQKITTSLSPDARLALFIGRRGSRLTAQSIWQRLRQRSLHAGLATPVHPHMLRHSFASHLLQSSGELRGVQELLGHANISTTQIYTRLDFQHLAKVYDQAHPRAHRKES